MIIYKNICHLNCNVNNNKNNLDVKLEEKSLSYWTKKRNVNLISSQLVVVIDLWKM